MKKRYLYSLLFAIPGLILSGILTLVILGFSAGAVWLFVLGDNLWPDSIGAGLTIVFALIFLVAWLGTIILGFVIGKHQEARAGVNKSHILISIGVTLLGVVLIAAYAWSVGNVGPKSEGVRCSDYCSVNGYSASSMPRQDSVDHSCSCLDHFGREMIKIPIDQIP